MTTVNNHDVAGLHARINRFIEEFHKSVSSGTSQVNHFDQTRMATYLDSIDIYHSWLFPNHNSISRKLIPDRSNLNQIQALRMLRMSPLTTLSVSCKSRETN